eukprot:m.315647 g.315647  ORF g.315647 m.315647 type:complete len:51 (+) comp23068_c0_seq44:1120-1272(+)
MGPTDTTRKLAILQNIAIGHEIRSFCKQPVHGDIGHAATCCWSTEVQCKD